MPKAVKDLGSVLSSYVAIFRFNRKPRITVLETYLSAVPLTLKYQNRQWFKKK